MYRVTQKVSEDTYGDEGVEEAFFGHPVQGGFFVTGTSLKSMENLGYVNLR